MSRAQRPEKLGAGVSARDLDDYSLDAARTIARSRFIPTSITWWPKLPPARLLLAADLVGPALDALKLEAASVRGPWKGKDLAELKFKHPFLDLIVPAVLADYVTLDQGTGIVHTAPGTWRRGFSDRAEIWHRGLRADRRSGALPRRLAGVQRQDGVRGQSHRCAAAARSRRAARRTENFRTAIRIAGAATIR